MRFRDLLTADMPDHFIMPEEFLTLADWIEKKKYLEAWRDSETGQDVVTGYLIDPETQSDYNVSHVYLQAGDTEVMNWTESDRLHPLGGTGSDGSYFHLWIDDEGNQQVVHTGSGSGSLLTATFPSALSVLRLFAVGYPDPCMQDDWADPPEDQYEFDREDKKLSKSSLRPYRKWLRKTWRQKTPRNGVEALNLTAEEGQAWIDNDGPPDDPFGRWLDSVLN
ncbi:hypothetical protein [Corynebacterium sp.]|uniref:hypothetical protein n=1 Tax=Corynebacterium sp. TaxID=1720 RepID=UPI0028A6488E|nr:hypothetical protein [Corynebacterium sp.]